MTRNEFIIAARSYIGTPFQHQGRLPGIGLDCAGVIVCAAQAGGYSVCDVAGYATVPSGGLLEQAVLNHCDRIALQAVRTGDILLFKFLYDPQHLAIFDNGMLIHAYNSVGKVVENGFDAAWQSKLVGCYSLRGIE